MFISSPRALFVFGGILGIGGIGLFGANETSKKTIKDALGNRKIIKEEIKEGNFGAWNRLISKMIHEKNSGYSKVKSPEFNLLEKEIYGSDSSQKLKEVCEKSIDLKYSDLFTKNKDLMDDVENFCFISIRDMLFEKPTFNVEGDSYSSEERNDIRKNIVRNMSNLSQEEIKNTKLSEIKDKFFSQASEAEESGIKLLFDLCKEGYKTPYSGDESIFLKDLIGKYCVKDSPSLSYLRYR